MFSAFNKVWQRQRLMYLGLNQDIFQARIFAIYVDPDNNCDVVVTTFPGQEIDFGTYEKSNGCLNITDWYGEQWDKTAKKATRAVNLKTSGPDPFKVFNSTISFTTPIFGEDNTTAVGILGIHFQENVFKTLIEPLTNDKTEEKRYDTG